MGGEDRFSFATDEDLAVLLRTVPPNELAALLAELHECHERLYSGTAIQRRIEAAALRHTDEATVLQHMIDAFDELTGLAYLILSAQERSYVIYLNLLLDVVQSTLLADSPVDALRLCETLMQAESSIYGNAADHEDAISDTVERIARIWLMAAEAMGGSAEFWVGRLIEVADRHTLGIGFFLIKHADELFSPAELAILYDRFVSKALGAADTLDNYHLFAALRQIAQLLEDPVRYEAAMSLKTQRMNSQDRLETARIYLIFGWPNKAQSILTSGEWNQFFEDSRQALLAEVYEFTSNLAERRETAWQRFRKKPDLENYAALKALLREHGSEELQREAIERATSDQDILRGALLLLGMGMAVEAEQRVLRHVDALDHANGTKLLYTLGKFHRYRRSIIEVLIHRVLLKRSLPCRSNAALTFALRCSRKLAELDARIDGYPEGVVSHEEFLRSFREANGDDIL